MNGELKELIDIINIACQYLTSGKSANFGEMGKIVINGCLSLFPKIIVSYSDEKMSDIAEEATYWPAQIERIMNTLDGEDSFAMFDVLFNETRANLIYISEEYEKRGIIL